MIRFDFPKLVSTGCRRKYFSVVLQGEIEGTAEATDRLATRKVLQ